MIPNVVNGLPVVRFGPVSNASQGASPSFPGLEFAESDYTVIAVVRTCRGP